MSTPDTKHDKHKRIVRQRILTAVMTLFILSLLSVGIYYGARAAYAEYEKKQALMPKPEPEPEALPKDTQSEDSAEEERWIITEDEEIEDDYADIPDISSNTVSDQTINEVSPEIEEKIASMSLEEKIAALFVVTPEDLTGVDIATAAGEATKEALKAEPVSGIIYFSQNINDPEQIKTMLENTQSYATEASGLPILLCIDEEGGSVSRIASNEAFGIEESLSMWETGLTGNMDDAYLAGEKIGKYLKEYGFNLDLAPVCDLVTSSENSAVGDRSFGSDPEEVSSLSWQFASGLSDAGVSSCFKHFPGIGDTEDDTHKESVILRKTLSELEEKELVPFENAIISGAGMIMAGHVSCPLITGEDNTPASLSKTMLTDVLRNGMNYNGVIITDSLKMNAVTDNYTPEEAAKLAIEAGADLILMPSDYQASKKALTDAVNSNEITEERIDESLKRILTLRSGI